jgi:putative membrane protein
MDPRFDQRGFPFPGRYDAMQHGGHGWHWVVPLAFVLLLTLGFLWLVLQTRSARLAGVAAPAGDAALTELRLRYARGEVTREEFLATEADLRGLQAPPPAA